MFKKLGRLWRGYGYRREAYSSNIQGDTWWHRFKNKRSTGYSIVNRHLHKKFKYSTSPKGWNNKGQVSYPKLKGWGKRRRRRAYGNWH